MTDHLDLDALADVLAGLPAPDHLADCADCQARLAELSAALPAVDAALAALPLPAEPFNLAGRLVATVGREAVGATAPPVSGSATVVPLTPQRGRWLPILSAAAAAAVLITAGVLLNQHRSGSSTTSAAPHYAVSSSGTDYAADGKALLAALPQLLKGGLQDKRAELGAAAGPQVPAPTAAQSDSSFGAASPAVAGLANLRTTDGLAACLAALTDPSTPGLPLALDYAEYADQPALVVVLPSAHPGKVDVFVVGAGCSQADAKVLLFTRLTKP